MGTAIKHPVIPVPDQVKLSSVIFDIRTLWAQDWASECPDVKKLQITNDGLTWCGTGCFIAVPI